MLQIVCSSSGQNEFVEAVFATTHLYAMVHRTQYVFQMGISWKWHRLVTRVAHINLNEDNDKFIWLLNRNGTFNVKSMYSYLINNGLIVTQEI